MTVTPRAEQKLSGLLRGAGGRYSGLRFEGYAGSCKGSVPMLRPARGPKAEDSVCELGALVFYVPPKYEAIFAEAILDFDPTFMGRGLNLQWPHMEGCPCHQ